MTAELNLQNHSVEEYRELLFDRLSETAVGDSLHILADRGIDPQLMGYQLEHDQALEWEYEHVDKEPLELRVTINQSLEDDELGTIDVRDLKPQRRHEVLLGIFDGLSADEGFILVNDHDPKPLFYELRSIHGEVIDWEYVTQGPNEWRVEVVKTEESTADTEEIITRYDVRDIPKPERHPTIHHRYGMIPAGETMEIVAPHEPKPLHQEFQRKYGDSFVWDIVEQRPGRCRVWITKESESDEQAEIEVVDELDVRHLPPAQRHQQIFEAYIELADNEGFVLINDHDPKPLYHQFKAEHGPELLWDYRQRDPGEFRVLIGKSNRTEASSTMDEKIDPPF